MKKEHVDELELIIKDMSNKMVLSEWRRAVDILAAERNIPEHPRESFSLMEVATAVKKSFSDNNSHAGNATIETIRVLRRLANLGLKESKDIADSVML